jgi:polyisoprenoid-binding protein YceI
LIEEELLMRSNTFRLAFAVSLFLGLGSYAAADEYVIDATHSGITFQISHLNLSHVSGRFDSFSGSFRLESNDPARSSFKLNIKSESIDTNNVQRDTHLRSPDFFNAKQFPAITFASTSVKPIEGGYEVTGDLTLHGTTRPLTFSLKGGRTAEFPKGRQRTGFTTELVLKRSDFGVGATERFSQLLGDDVFVSIGFEGTKR